MIGPIVSCDYLGQRYSFAYDPSHWERVEAGLPIPARDVSSQFDTLEPGEKRSGVSLLILACDDADGRRRWQRQLAALAELTAFPHPPPFLAPVAFGPVLDGEYAGQLLLVCEPWEETLRHRLVRDALTQVELESVHQTLALALFHLHQRGYSHGGVCPDALVWTATGWKLGPGDTPPAEAADAAADVAGVGVVLFAALRLPVPDDAVGLRAAERIESLVGQFESLSFGLPPRRTRGWLDRMLGEPERSGWRGALPPEWLPILGGCLARDPRRRWTAARLLLGGGPPPEVNRLRLVTVGRGVEVTWDPPAYGEAALYDRPATGAMNPGEVVPASALGGYGTPLPTTGTSLRLTGAEQRRLQVVTHWKDVAIVGAVLDLSALPDVTGLDVQPRDGSLWIRWEWPHGASVARVVVRADRFATSPAREPFFHEVARRVYESAGGVEYPVPVVGAWLYVSVFIVQRTHAGLAASPGARVGARWEGVGQEVRVEYRIAGKSGQDQHPGYSSFDMSLTAEDSVGLPELRLVGGRSRVPELAEHGMTLATFPAGLRVEAGRGCQAHFGLVGDGPWYVRLFSPDGPEGAGITLVSRRVGGYRLG